jgi:hypothetical protein
MTFRTDYKQYLLNAESQPFRNTTIRIEKVSCRSLIIPVRPLLIASFVSEIVDQDSEARLSACMMHIVASLPSATPTRNYFRLA